MSVAGHLSGSGALFTHSHRGETNGPEWALEPPTSRSRFFRMNRLYKSNASNQRRIACATSSLNRATFRLQRTPV